MVYSGQSVILDHQTVGSMNTFVTFRSGSVYQVGYLPAWFN